MVSQLIIGQELGGSFLHITQHAQKRMQQRRIDLDMVEAVIQFGREVCTRGSLYYAVGRNEVDNAAQKDRDIRHLDGVQVVTSLEDGSVLTVYRNRDFRLLRANMGRGRFRPAGC